MSEMDKCREEFEKRKYWIGLFRADVDFDMTLGKFGRYVSNGSRRIDAMYLESFNEKWEAWANAWQHQQAKVEELQKQLSEYIFVSETLDEMYVKEVQKSDELQKRVESLRRKQEAAEKLIWKWAESTEHAHFALQCASELKEALEVRGAPVLEAEGRFYVLGMEGWIAGVYASRKAAELAYETKDNSEFLEKLAYEINQKQGRDITLGDLEQALKGGGQ